MKGLLIYLTLVFGVSATGCGRSDAEDAQVLADPVVVAPDEFQVALENERVRVLRVSVVDGEAPGPHSHPERVVVFLTDCTWLDESDDGTVTEETNLAGEVFWMEAMSHEGGPNGVRDTCELLEMELK